MYLHEAMVVVLRERGSWTDRDELAREIADRGLYLRRSGETAPSDQLRLRARKYGHLFEGSDPAFTQIRLRAEAPGSADLSEGSDLPADTPGSKSSVGGNAARRLRTRAANRYKPDQVELLLIAEAPPAAADRYFYFESVQSQDSLFRYVARSILGVEPTRDDKPVLLGALRDRGVFLIDLKLDPTDGRSLRECVPDVVRRARHLRPRRIILIKATVYDAAFVALRQAGLPVVDERVPFPGSGQQRRFESAFARALKVASGGR